MPTAYKVIIGSYTATQQARDGDRLLLGLMVELGMDGGGLCRVELSGAEFAPVAPGDPVKVELDVGEGMVTVFTGEAVDSEATATAQCVTAFDAVFKLTGMEAETAYADVALDFIIKDLISQTGAKVGTVSAGPQVPFYAIHRGAKLATHVRRLAEACGADVYSKGDGKIWVAAPGEGATEHAFQFGENVLALQVVKNVLPFDSVEVWGEGAGSSQGSDKSHWLTGDISGVSGKAAMDDSGQVSTGKLGSRPQLIRDGALRTGGAAEDSAKARATWMASRSLSGRLDVRGAPAVMPGDTVKLEKLPASHAASRLLTGGAKLRVRRVRHVLDRERGFMTRLEF